ncbi:SCA7, zinc-binding domain-domain-containing protein [Syncephalastrum racemosum]|uniref:SCA7, zinc-binding domain-domain-containing protein n=1 Tax=Syncephalastrum racemosum TaxID=13706 RepID=A0A1X2H5E4_SYNRA|nr:SCA7, zinc-binding domain-domain-containing protein [Syncephalastrum racemosum]
MTSSNGPSKKHEHLTEEQQAILREKGAEIDRLQQDITALSKPLTAADAGQQWSKHVTPGTLSVFQDAASWEKVKDDKRMHKPNGKSIQDVSSWKKMRDMLDSSEGEDLSSLSESELSPIVTKFDVKDRKTFGTLPMEEDQVIVNCKQCTRPIYASSFQKHLETCGKGSKKPRAQVDNAETNKISTKGFFTDDEEDEDDDDDDADDEDPIALRRQNTSTHKKKKRAETEESVDMSSLPTKRPPSTNSERPEKKKTKKEKQKAKATPKQKAPLDLDKQCGVIQGPNNTPCTRSLTCKSHSMGAKRAVAGRSQPYDVLLSAYQKKAIGRPQTSGSDKKGITAQTAKTTTKSIKKFPTTPAEAQAPTEEQFVNSDEEVENVMQALKSKYCAPLAEKPFYFVKRRRQSYRLRDVLLDTITPKSAFENQSMSSMMSSGYDNHTNHTSTPPPSSLPPHLQQQRMSQLSYQQQQQQQQQNMMNGSPVSSPSAQMSQLQQQQQQQQKQGLSGMIGFSGSMDSNMYSAVANGRSPVGYPIR